MKKSKRFRFAGDNRITTSIAETVRQGHAEAGDFNVEVLDLDRIEPDPQNPRALALTADEIAWLKNEEVMQVMREESVLTLDERQQMLLRLRDLADSIRKHGVQQPIRVYRHADCYRIVYGERRYWGSIIAGRSNIPAAISPARPPLIHSLQLIENIHREDLDLPARLRNVAGVVEELEEQSSGAVVTASLLGQVIGVSERQARKYLAVLRGPDDIFAAIIKKHIDNLDVAAELVSIDDAERPQLIASLANGASIDEARETIVPARRRQSRVGRPATRINLGSTTNSSVIKAILSRFADEIELDQVDWDDFASVNQTWKHFLQNLERRA
jgi:ParB family chromosome partitioning protein